MNNRLNNAEEWIRALEDRIMEITRSEQQTDKWGEKNESNMQDLWDNVKHDNLCIIGVPKKRSEMGIKNIFEETMTENSNWKKEIDIQVKEAQRVTKKGWNQTDSHQGIIS